MIKVGIIGGSGLDDPCLLKKAREKNLKTPYGQPSSKLRLGQLKGIEVVILARHGQKHNIPPHQVNFLANLYALKQTGCTQILATTAVGSLREKIKPGQLVFPNQFIDFTRQRQLSFFTKRVIHTPMVEPYDQNLRQLLCQACRELGYSYNQKATLLTIEGPRFSTKAESQLFRRWGADVINMSTCPEVILANELGIPYQTIAISTDYDCWKDKEEPVSFEMIVQRMKENAQKVKKLIIRTIILLKKQSKNIKV